LCLLFSDRKQAFLFWMYPSAVVSQWSTGTHFDHFLNNFSSDYFKLKQKGLQDCNPRLGLNYNAS